MRALISWDVDRADPEFQRILIAIVDSFPQQTLEMLTNQTARANKITQKQFVAINERLERLAVQYARRMFYVFSLHSDKDPIYAEPRPVSTGPAVVAVTPTPGVG